MVLPKLKRHLNAENTLSDHDSIHRHRNLNNTERSAITRPRNFNAPKFCKITVCVALFSQLNILYLRTFHISSVKISAPYSKNKMRSRIYV